jgi:hypothetical protein
MFYPLHYPERGELIDGSIGEGSPFERQFGYFARGVDETTAVLPRGWKDRLVPVTNPNTRYATGWCLEVHDLAIARYVAGREKDLLYTRALAQYRMTRRQILRERLGLTDVPDVLRTVVAARIEADFS